MKKLDLNRTVERYKEISNQIALLEEQKNALTEHIKLAMGETEELRVCSGLVRFKTVNSTRFNTTSFKSEYSDLYSQFCKVSTSRRFTVA